MMDTNSGAKRKKDGLDVLVEAQVKKILHEGVTSKRRKVTVNLNVRDLQVYSHVQPDSGVVRNVLQSPVIPVQHRTVDDPG
jgi:hypothetical protein